MRIRRHELSDGPVHRGPNRAPVDRRAPTEDKHREERLNHRLPYVNTQRKVKKKTIE